MIKGQVKFYSDKKGYGYIIGNNETEYYFHISGVVERLKLDVDQIVEFTPTETSKGFQALNVVRIDG